VKIFYLMMSLIAEIKAVSIFRDHEKGIAERVSALWNFQKKWSPKIISIDEIAMKEILRPTMRYENMAWKAHFEDGSRVLLTGYGLLEII